MTAATIAHLIWWPLIGGGLLAGLGWLLVGIVRWERGQR